jgi:hypothetical protein
MGYSRYYRGVPVEVRAMELPPGVEPWEYLSQPLSEKVLQRQGHVALTGLGFEVDELSQIHPALMALGIPDTVVMQPRCPIGLALIEWKKPRLMKPGVKPGTWVIAQYQTYRTFEQEARYRDWTRCGVRIVTADSVDLAIGALAFWGYDIPAAAVRKPFDPADQLRFYDPKAVPRAAIRAQRRRQGARLNRAKLAAQQQARARRSL